jgi:hypothetical protein
MLIMDIEMVIGVCSGRRFSVRVVVSRWFWSSRWRRGRFGYVIRFIEDHFVFSDEEGKDWRRDIQRWRENNPHLQLVNV